MYRSTTSNSSTTDQSRWYYIRLEKYDRLKSDEEQKVRMTSLASEIDRIAQDFKNKNSIWIESQEHASHSLAYIYVYPDPLATLPEIPLPACRVEVTMNDLGTVNLVFEKAMAAILEELNEQLKKDIVCLVSPFKALVVRQEYIKTVTVTPL